MKKYFQNIYNETGVKPFTFLNCALTLLVPLIIFLVVGCNMSSTEGNKVITISVIALIACWGIDIALLFNKFKNGKRTAILFFLGLLASIAFFCKLILFPLIKLCLNLMTSSTSVQMGDFASASNNANRATAEAGGIKMSAFNWFVYDDRVFTDIEPDIPEDTATNYGAWNNELGRTFNDNEEQNARNMGYRDAKQAYDSGVKLDDITK